MKYRALSSLLSLVCLLSIAERSSARPAAQDSAAEHARVQTLSIEQAPDRTLLVHGLAVRGRSYRVVMQPHDLRSDGFRVLVGGTELSEYPVPEPSTYRGQVEDDAGHVTPIAASLTEAGEIQAYIAFADGAYSVQPAAGGMPGEHEVLPADDFRKFLGMCATTEVSREVASGSLADGVGGGVQKVCKIAFDVDFEFFQSNNSSVALTIRWIEFVMAGVALIYERDVDIAFEKTTFVVRTNSADPYTTNVASDLLLQFRDVWNGTGALPDVLRAVDRDVAHLVTSRALVGSTGGEVIGVAYVGVICDSHVNGFGYGLSNLKVPGSSLAERVALAAHEIGHNWNAQHCAATCAPAPGCNIMCPCLTDCSNVFDRFGTGEIDQIVLYRDSTPISNCVQDYPGETTLAPYFSDRFPNALLDLSRWPYAKGVLLDDTTITPPDFSPALRLSTSGSEEHQDHEIRTNELDLASIVPPPAGIGISYATEHRGVEVGEKLVVEYYAANLNGWRPLAEHVSDGVDQDEFELHAYAVPSDALHASFRLRFRTELDESNDLWFVDLVRIGPKLVGLVELDTPRLTPGLQAASPGKIAVATAGDRNADGRDDFLVGYPNSGRVFLCSGLNGLTLSEWDNAVMPGFGSSLAVLGSVGGGCVDFLIGAPGTSSAPGVLTRFCRPNVIGSFAGDQFGFSVAPIGGDLNADGVADFVVGAPAKLGSHLGYARVVSGADNATLFQFQGANFGDGFGYSVDGAGDVDGDGVLDILVGIPFASLQSGSVRVYSGASGALIRTENGPFGGEHLGWSVSGLGDLDGDGHAEFVAGAPTRATSMGSQSGVAYVFGGESAGAVRFELFGDFQGDHFGWSVDGMKDINRDGIRDVLVGAPGGDFDSVVGPSGPGSCHVFSGANGGKLYELRGEGPGEYFGGAVAFAGKVKTKGDLQILVGAFEHAPASSPKAYVYTMPNSSLIQQGQL